MTATTMPILTAARLVAGHVNILWSQWANETDPEFKGCCPECCGPCNALRDLLEAGQLDELYGAWLAQDESRSFAWDFANRQVGRDWLAAAWSGDRGCRDQHEESR